MSHQPRPVGVPGATPDRAAPASPPPVSLRLLVLAIFLVALNLRAALASLPPLVRTIQDDLDLNAATAGLLTTLPVLCMGLFAPVARPTGSAARRRSPGPWPPCWWASCCASAARCCSC